MEIKDFIKEALLQIVDGVTSANSDLKSKVHISPQPMWLVKEY